MEPLSDPFDSLEPPTPTPMPRDLRELPNRPPLGPESNEPTPRAPRGLRDSSIDPLTQNTPLLPLFTSANLVQSRTELGAKRGPPSSPLIRHIDKNRRLANQQTFQFSASSNTTNTDEASNLLVLVARDLLVKAYSAT